MTPLRTLLAAPVLLLACAGSSYALDITYEQDNLRMPVKPVSEEQRRADLALGNCLKRNGGRMESCNMQREQSERIAQANKELAPTAVQPNAPVTSVVVESGPTIVEGAPLPPHQ